MRCFVLASLAVTLLVVSGCGGGGGGGATTTASAGTPAPPPPPPGPAATPGPSAPPPSAKSAGASTTIDPMGGLSGDGYDPMADEGAGDGYDPMGADYDPMGADYDPMGPDYDPGYDPGYGSGMPGYGPGGQPYGPGGMAGGAGRMPLPAKSLREQAIDLLRAGQHEEGFKLLNTHLAVGPGGETELAENMQWYPALRRPALGPQIGIAVLYINAPRDFDGSPMPIGSPEAEKAATELASLSTSDRSRRGRRGGGGSSEPSYDDAGLAGGSETYEDYGAMSGGGGAARNGGSEEARKQLEFHTGEIGTKLLTALKERIAAGQYGPAYQSLLAEMAQPAETRPGAQPGYGSAYSQSYDPGMGDDYDPGMVDGGMPGPSGYPGPGGPGMRGPPGRPGAAASDADAAKPLSLDLAITWIGKGYTKDELDSLLSKADCDVLVTFELTVRPTPRIVTNVTKIRVANLRNKDVPQFVSAGMENRSIIQERQKGLKGEDPVDKQVARAVEMIDKHCQGTPLPDVFTPEVVKRRIASLVASSEHNPLPALVEARYYVAKGLLPEEEFSAAAVALMGEAEFAELVKKVPDAGFAQVVGTAHSLSGLLSAIRGVNQVASTVNKQPAGPPNANAPRQQGGLGSFLPFGVPGFGGGRQQSGSSTRGPGGYPGPTPSGYPSGSPGPSGVPGPSGAPGPGSGGYPGGTPSGYPSGSPGPSGVPGPSGAPGPGSGGYPGATPSGYPASAPRSGP